MTARVIQDTLLDPRNSGHFNVGITNPLTTPARRFPSVTQPSAYLFVQPEFYL